MKDPSVPTQTVILNLKVRQKAHPPPLPPGVKQPNVTLKQMDQSKFTLHQLNEGTAQDTAVQPHKCTT